MQAEQFEVVAEIDRTHWWFVGRRAIMRSILGAYLTPGPETTVVDVGCGPGANIASLADLYTCVGVDTAPEAIVWAEERFPEVRYICGDAPADLGEVAGRADAYLLMDVLEHVEGDRELLESIVAVLKPGGIVFVTVPADERLWSEQDVQLGHHRRYSTTSLRLLWEDLPVDELMISHFNTRLYPAVRVVRTASRLVGRSWGKAGSDMRPSKGPVNRILAGLFTGESRRLLSLTNEQARRPYRHGVSLVAVLRRTHLEQVVPREGSDRAGA